MGKKKLVFLIILLLVSVFFVFNYSFDILGKISITGKAVQETISLGIEIISNEENEVNVPTGGNVTFSNSFIRKRVAKLTGLNEGWRVNVSLRGINHPTGWSEPEPNSSEVGNLKIEYFELTTNGDRNNQSSNIYFNVTRDELGSVPTENISLFIYDNDWINLSTFVLDGVSNPASFYGVAPHFSKFLIGESPPSVEGGEPEEETPPPSDNGGGGGGSAIPIKPKKLEETRKVGEIPKPIHIPGNFFDISLIIPGEYQELTSGEELAAEVKIINIGSVDITSIIIDYYIEDWEGNTILESYETKTIEGETHYIKMVELPADIELGYYMFMIKVKYNGDMALAGYPFEVISKQPTEMAPSFGKALLQKCRQIIIDYCAYIICLVVLLLILVAIVWWKKKKG